MIATDGIRTIANAGGDEVATERRLAHEADTRELGRFCAPGCDTAFNATDVCKVEVTRGYFTDDEGFSLRENAGYYVVYVSTTPGGEHPANIASDAVYAKEDRGDWDYFSVDDVFPY
jgi:hypothetical protein